MKLIYATFAAAVMAAIATGEARADEPASEPTGVSPYGKTVCEGRTWDYRIYASSAWDDPVIEVRTGYHFSGTERINGCEYAVFRDGADKKIALMREEAEKVYLYVPDPDEEESVGYTLSIRDYTDMDKFVTGDLLVYDFTLQPGDEYICPCFDDYGNHDYADLEKFEIRSTSTFEFQGENYIIQEFDYLRNPIYPDLRVIEGVGNTKGILPFPQIVNVVPGLNKIHYNLLRVTDADGGILYEDKNLLPTVSPYGKTVCEGRTWDYYLALGGYPEESRVLYGYHFDGVKAVGGQLYAVFCDGEDKPLALMREYAQKVYLYVPGQDEETLPGAHIEVGDKSGNVTGDVLLYDFSLEPRDRFVSPCFGNGVGDYGVLYDFEIMNTSTFDFNGESYCIQDFETGTGFNREVFKTIEGVGNTSGLLPCPQMLIRVTGLNFRDYTPVRVTDDKGGVLYEDEKFWADVTTPVASEEPSAIYDILGRRVTVPVAGNIYIRDGKKILWK